MGFSCFPKSTSLRRSAAAPVAERGDVRLRGSRRCTNPFGSRRRGPPCWPQRPEITVREIFPRLGAYQPHRTPMPYRRCSAARIHTHPHGASADDRTRCGPLDRQEDRQEDRRCRIARQRIHIIGSVCTNSIGRTCVCRRVQRLPTPSNMDNGTAMRMSEPMRSNSVRNSSTLCSRHCGSPLR